MTPFEVSTRGVAKRLRDTYSLGHDLSESRTPVRNGLPRDSVARAFLSRQSSLKVGDLVKQFPSYRGFYFVDFVADFSPKTTPERPQKNQPNKSMTQTKHQDQRRISGKGRSTRAFLGKRLMAKRGGGKSQGRGEHTIRPSPKVGFSPSPSLQESPRQTKPKKGQLMNFSQGHSGTKVQCESCLFSQGKNTRIHKNGRNS